jgi:hypothetical protein
VSSRERLGAAWDVVVLATTIAYIAESTTYPSSEQTFPRLIAYPVAALAFVSIVRRIPPLRRAAEAAAPVEAHAAIDVRLLALGIGLAAAYAALWSVLGFALDTVALLVVGPKLLGLGPKGLAACAGIAVAIVVLFSYLFGTSGMGVLPGGVFGWQIPW